MALPVAFAAGHTESCNGMSLLLRARFKRVASTAQRQPRVTAAAGGYGRRHTAGACSHSQWRLRAKSRRRRRLRRRRVYGPIIAGEGGRVEAVSGTRLTGRLAACGLPRLQPQDPALFAALPSHPPSGA